MHVLTNNEAASAQMPGNGTSAARMYYTYNGWMDITAINLHESKLESNKVNGPLESGTDRRNVRHVCITLPPGRRCANSLQEDDGSISVIDQITDTERN